MISEAGSRIFNPDLVLVSEWSEVATWTEIFSNTGRHSPWPGTLDRAVLELLQQLPCHSFLSQAVGA